LDLIHILYPIDKCRVIHFQLEYFVSSIFSLLFLLVSYYGIKKSRIQSKEPKGSKKLIQYANKNLSISLLLRKGYRIRRDWRKLLVLKISRKLSFLIFESRLSSILFKDGHFKLDLLQQKMETL